MKRDLLAVFLFLALVVAGLFVIVHIVTTQFVVAFNNAQVVYSVEDYN